ncbi:hypothetical protein Y1Q_0012384 [Alligator mississippiensis]|uniref:C-type lectin domain-containing protein n=1 Tax=Alligator mississippiensis TaxID=8496 RepID=A0A151MZW9_ALLMI|nr:hypothetical protein Y1Q_0012384 [Alligator mississippiensis]
MPSFLTNTDVSYWIGLQKSRGRWMWINKTPYPNGWKLKGNERRPSPAAPAWPCLARFPPCSLHAALPTLLDLSQPGCLCPDTSTSSTFILPAQEELARTRAELAQAWQEGNHSQDELHRWDTELQETKVQLGQMQEQAWDLQQQLNKTESALASAWPCQVTDCCPETWVLHRGKCLFLSKEKKTWKDSKKWCEQESAQLLILWDWDKMKMPSFLTTMDTLYWIGLRRDWKTMGRWTWIDGTEYSE